MAFDRSPLVSSSEPANSEEEDPFHWDVESVHSESDDSDYDPADDIPTSDESDPDSQLDQDARHSQPAIQTQQTALLRANLHDNLAAKVKMDLVYMDAVGINLPILLDTMSWGDPACTQDAKIRYERSALLNSVELPGILRRWWKPPRPHGSHRVRPKGAKAAMQDFALYCSREVPELELEKAELTGTSFPKLIEAVKKVATNLWRVLMELARSPTQQKRSLKKDPSMTVIIVIALFEYTRSRHRGRLQKLFSIYFKFKGLSAKGFDTLHVIGLTMSSTWTNDALGRISEAAMKDIQELMDKFPWLMSYDNVLIAFRVFAQRIDKKTLHRNGTAATVYIKRSSHSYATNYEPITARISNRGFGAPSSLSHRIHSPEFEFEFESHPKPDHPLFQLPAAVRELLCGPDHITLQFLLGTVDIPEVAYEDNSRLINELLQQLKLDSKALQKKIGLDRIMAWVGDQLTVDQLRNLFRFRAEDDNSFERLDWLVVPAGWLHICMAFGNSIHKQHLGTSKGRGLSAAFDQLQRKGLQSSKTQGPFFHDLNETLHIIAEAQVRELWPLVGKVKSLAELRQRSPEDLHKLAAEIVSQHASSAALVTLRAKNGKDELKEQSVIFLRDVLPYILLRAAIKRGDVGLMEDMIPQLLSRFVAGRNSKYSIERLELLQGLNRDWPPQVWDFVRDNCWVINNTGRRAGHMPVDEAQEMNIKDIKVTHRSEGPQIDWKYLKKLHPAIHKWYRASNTHRFTAGRKIPTKSESDRPADVVTKGFVNLQTGETIKNWVEGRTIERATHQDWDSVAADSD
ncbi:hypothetical protein DFH09DRAFT_1439496 [Mycena vulgaris]|nr:hypothetical protein DFH09DRAFT_1439496 [Mycena vulgaris]